MTSGIPEHIWEKHMRLLFWLRFIQIPKELAEQSRIEQLTEQTWKEI